MNMPANRYKILEFYLKKAPSSWEAMAWVIDVNLMRKRLNYVQLEKESPAQEGYTYIYIYIWEWDGERIDMSNCE